MLGNIRTSTFTKRNLNYWSYVFTYDKTWNETFGESDYGFDNFVDCYKAIKEDKKVNESFMKSSIQEPRCYYRAVYYEWSEEDNCYYYTEYDVYTRKLKNGSRKIYAKVVD